MVTVSICIVGYNCEKTIARALKSLANQTVRPFEIIFVNDASTDDTLQIVERLQGQLPGLKIYTMDKNSGVGKCRDLAIKMASGDYVLAMDADDTMPKDSLKTLSHIATLYGSDAVAGAVASLDANGKVKRITGIDRRLPNVNPIEWPQFSTLSTGWHFALLIRRSIIIDNGISYSQGGTRVSSDGYFLFNLIWHIKTMTFLPDVTYHYHDTPESISKKRQSIEYYRDDFSVYKSLVEHADNLQKARYSGERIFHRLEEFFRLDIFKFLPEESELASVLSEISPILQNQDVYNTIIEKYLSKMAEDSVNALFIEALSAVRKGDYETGVRIIDFMRDQRK